LKNTSLDETKKPKYQRPIHDFKLYVEDLERCFYDGKPLPSNQQFLSSEPVPEFEELYQRFELEHKKVLAKPQYKNKFVFAGPSVNVSKEVIYKPSTNTYFPAPRMTAEKGFKQRFVDFNFKNRGGAFSMVMPIDIDQTGAKEDFVDILLEHNLPLPLIIDNIVSGRFQAHYIFDEFHSWEDLWKIRDTFNRVLTSRGIKVDSRQYRLTRNPFFNPYVIDKETGEVTFQKGYTNAKDLNEDFNNISWQAHDAKITLFDNFRIVHLEEFEAFVRQYCEEDETIKENTVSVQSKKAVISHIKPAYRNNEAVPESSILQNRMPDPDFYYNLGEDEGAWKEYTKLYFDIKDFPSLDYLIQHPSTVPEGNRYNHMVMVVKSAFTKDVSNNLIRNHGILPTGYEAHIQPKLRQAIKAQYPGHSDKQIETQAKHMMKKTVQYMIATYDPDKASNGGKKYLSTIRWGDFRMNVGETNEDYFTRIGMKKKKFYSLQKQQRIKRNENGSLVALSSIAIVVNQDKLNHIRKKKKAFLERVNVKYSSTVSSSGVISVSNMKKSILVQPAIPPPRTMQELRDLRIRDLNEIFDF
jgi:hypothetical protein